MEKSKRHIHKKKATGAGW